MSEMTMKFNNPLTDEQWEMLTDSNMENTNEITFFTKNGNKFKFVKSPQWIPCSERLPEHFDWYLVSNKDTSWVALWKDGVFLSVSGYFEFNDIIAWMPLPEPYQDDFSTHMNPPTP